MKLLSSGLLFIAIFVCLHQYLGTPTVGAQSCPLYPSEHQRIGFNFDRTGDQQLDNYEYAQLNAGWFHDYSFRETVPDGIRYHQMVRPSINLENITDTLGIVVDANRGAIWYVGNEPDKAGLQDDMTPAEYASFYHTVYTFLKQRDPTSQVAIAGVVQATPLRLAYLDAVLAAYQEQNGGSSMPIDVMTVHGFILCEVCEGWGAGIPPGMAEYASIGRNYEVSDHINLEIFKEQIVAMRRWMADRGFRDRPLIVNEYGVLMPVYFEGFGYLEVRDFMLATFDFFRTAVDEEIGYGRDGNRLVQEWAWFSLNAPPYYVDEEGNADGHNGELFDNVTFAMKQWGLDYRLYTTPLVQQTDVTITDVQINPSLAVSGTVPQSVDVTVSLQNRGNLTAHGISVSLWQGDPDLGGSPIGSTYSIEQLESNGSVNLQFQWAPGAVANGRYEIVANIVIDSCNPAATAGDSQERRSVFFVVVPQNELNLTYFPLFEQ